MVWVVQCVYFIVLLITASVGEALSHKKPASAGNLEESKKNDYLDCLTIGPSRPKNQRQIPDNLHNPFNIKYRSSDVRIQNSGGYVFDS